MQLFSSSRGTTPLMPDRVSTGWTWCLAAGKPFVSSPGTTPASPSGPERVYDCPRAENSVPERAFRTTPAMENQNEQRDPLKRIPLF